MKHTHARLKNRTMYARLKCNKWFQTLLITLLFILLEVVSLNVA